MNSGGSAFISSKSSDPKNNPTNTNTGGLMNGNGISPSVVNVGGGGGGGGGGVGGAAIIAVKKNPTHTQSKLQLSNKITADLKILGVGVGMGLGGSSNVNVHQPSPTVNNIHHISHRRTHEVAVAHTHTQHTQHTTHNTCNTTLTYPFFLLFVAVAVWVV